MNVRYAEGPLGLGLGIDLDLDLEEDGNEETGIILNSGVMGNVGSPDDAQTKIDERLGKELEFLGNIYIDKKNAIDSSEYSTYITPTTSNKKEKSSNGEISEKEAVDKGG